MLDFTRETADIQAFLSTQSATGGGDFAEDWAGGLRMALDNLSWREQSEKLVMIVADAPGHGLFSDSHREQERPKIIRALEELAERQIRLGFVEVKIRTGQGDTEAAMNEAAQIYLTHGGVASTVDSVIFERSTPRPVMYDHHPPDFPSVTIRGRPPLFRGGPRFPTVTGLHRFTHLPFRSVPPVAAAPSSAAPSPFAAVPPSATAPSSPSFSPSPMSSTSSFSSPPPSYSIGRRIMSSNLRLLSSRGFSSEATPSSTYEAEWKPPESS